MLKEFGLDQAAEWFKTVRQFHNHDVYYFPQYAKAFHLHKDGEPICFYYENGGTKAVNVVMKRDIAQCKSIKGIIPENTFYDFATPYGYGGFIIEGDRDVKALKILNEEYCACCESKGIVSEFVRFHPLLKNHCGLEPIYNITELGKTVSIDLTSPEVILANMVPQARNKMRKAQSNGIEIRFGDDEELFAEFEGMYNATMDRKHALPYYYFGRDFYESIRTDLNGNAFISYAVLKGKTIAMAIILHANQKMHIHLEASKENYMHLAPIALLVVKTALWGSANGFKTLHFGGGVGAQADSLYRFKSSFNRNSNNRFVIGKKIFDREKYDYLCKLSQRVAGVKKRPEFFPQYRDR